ncbi:ribosomal protein LP0-like [Arctopsyche grandis]|uniref:ribosomal protein LP0-like n=1 Tax=Arctopsyche grandis TaxID=121162 RepID=UPI00406D6554
MPKSKRDKKVSLTKTIKKGLVLKQHIIDDIRKSIEKYSGILLFTVHNMRNAKLKDLRSEWKDSRFFFGKNKVMALGLGKSESDEAHDKLHHLSERLVGQCGLLFTNRPIKEATNWFEDFSEDDYARAGFVATQSVTLPEGPLEDFPHSIEPHLRQLGLPTSLQRGIVTLLKSHEVCKKGQPLTPEQARILKLLDKKMAVFKLTVKCYWTKDGGFQKQDVKEKNEDEEDLDMQVEDET